MKILISITAIICAFHSSSIAQEWKLAIARPSSSVSVLVPEGNIIEFGTPLGSWSASVSVSLDFGGGATKSSATLDLVAPTARYVGPVTLTASLGGNVSGFISIPYRITNSISASVIPSNAVVIPTNATGNVQIILESSTDLVNWISATSGTYSSSTQSRFFRVRAIQQ
jgi:hypothetical protein